MAKIDILFPVSRLVMGNLYKPQDKDADGKPLVIKSGPNAGKPTVKYFFAVAIPKGAETSWTQTEWGMKIYSAGSSAFPRESQTPHFAWKVTDGDSNVPNKKGNRPIENEGFPGHWVVSMSSSYAPKIYGDGGNTVLTEEGRVKTGYYVQVLGSVDGNGSSQNPGVFINHSMVCFIAFGDEINFGTDPRQVGFAAQRDSFPTAPAPVLPASHPTAPPPGVTVVTAPAPAPAPVPTVPNPAVLQVPAPKKMTALAQGVSYEQFIAAGWTDVQLIQQGYLLA